jgi:hypothetical protein
MSTTDTANILEITEENVKVRLHRARALLREGLYASKNVAEPRKSQLPRIPFERSRPAAGAAREVKLGLVACGLR